MTFRSIQLIALTIALAAAGAADAAVLADYRFTSGSSASSDADPNSTALAFTVTNGDLTAADSGLSTTSHNAFLRSNATAPANTANHPDQAGALDDDDYFSFQVSANGSYVLNLTSLVFDFGASTGTNITLNNTIYVQSSVDGFGSSNLVIASFDKSTFNTGGGSGNLTTIAPIDLTASKFQGLASIQFRFFFSDDLNTSGEINRLDNVVLNGITAIPSPAALPAGLALLAGGLMRRRVK